MSYHPIVIHASCTAILGTAVPVSSGRKTRLRRCRFFRVGRPASAPSPGRPLGGGWSEVSRRSSHLRGPRGETEEEYDVTYVIAQPCVDVLDKACIEECPVDCIYEGGRMLYIHPDECVDCGACDRYARWRPSTTRTTCPANGRIYKANVEFFEELGSPEAPPRSARSTGTTR